MILTVRIIEGKRLQKIFDPVKCKVGYVLLPIVRAAAAN